MKKIIIINGPMGVGKTTIGKLLCNKLNKSAFLDGDWCFDLHYKLFQITLTCSETALEKRWNLDKINDWRIESWLEISKKSLSYFQNLETFKVDTSDNTPEYIVQKVYDLIN